MHNEYCVCPILSFMRSIIMGGCLDGSYESAHSRRGLSSVYYLATGGNCQGAANRGAQPAVWLDCKLLKTRECSDEPDSAPAARPGSSMETERSPRMPPIRLRSPNRPQPKSLIY